MTFDPRKGHAALRRGRVSPSGSEYFLTVATVDRCAGLHGAVTSAAISAEVNAMSVDGTWFVRCWIIMPDHLHLLVHLGERLSLERAVQRLKAKTAASLRLAGCSWERGFFDRRLRPDENRLPIFLYVYLNPYRAGLLRATDTWPDFHCGAEDWDWFRHELDRDLPVPEWLL